MGQPIVEVPSVPSDARVRLRCALVTEEFVEFCSALTGQDCTEYFEHEIKPQVATLVIAPDLVQLADALADIAYVICGTALEFGIPLDAVFAEVHRSNLSKIGPDGKPVVLPNGKIGKHAGYSPADVAGILRRAGGPL